MKKKLLYVFVLFLFATGNVNGSDGESFYRISPGDELEISVWKDDSLSRQLVVPPDGFISFPLIGDIDTKNFTVTDLRETVTKRLSEYVTDATVTVILLKATEHKAYVIGKVNRPGEFLISADTNAMQILAMAGGLNPFASEGNILILRRSNNSVIKIPFDYKQVESGKNLEQNIIIKNGDVVVVP